MNIDQVAREGFGVYALEEIAACHKRIEELEKKVEDLDQDNQQILAYYDRLLEQSNEYVTDLETLQEDYDNLLDTYRRLTVRFVNMRNSVLNAVTPTIERTPNTRRPRRREARRATARMHFQE